MKTRFIALLFAFVAICGCDKGDTFIGTKWKQGDTEIRFESASVVYFSTKGYWPREGTYTKNENEIVFNLRTDNGGHIDPAKWSEETWERVSNGFEIKLISGRINGETMDVKYTYTWIANGKDFKVEDKEFNLKKVDTKYN